MATENKAENIFFGLKVVDLAKLHRGSERRRHLVRLRR